MSGWLLLVLLCCLEPAQPASCLSDDPLLGRIRAIMLETLRRMPDYTCIQTIERWREGDPCSQCRSWERLRLEVALIGGKERFAWPRADEFSDEDIQQLVPPGAISTGEFSGFATAIFRSAAACVAGPFAELVDGRATYRYDYRVPVERSTYTLKDGRTSTRVGYHGSFWVDRQSLELLRLDVEADGLPAPPLEITGAATAIRYQKIPIAGSLFLMPALSELNVTSAGRRSRNRTSFTQCRQYTGQSTLRFDDPAVGGTTPAQTPQPRRLPPGLNLELSLAAPLDPKEAAAGDLVEATLARDARRHGELLAPKGSRVYGRLLRVRQQLAPRSLGLLVLDFNRLQAPGLVAEFRARLEMLGGMVPGARRPSDVMVLASEDDSALVFNGPLLRLPRGFRMLWRTQE